MGRCIDTAFCIVNRAQNDSNNNKMSFNKINMKKFAEVKQAWAMECKKNGNDKLLKHIKSAQNKQRSQRIFIVLWNGRINATTNQWNKKEPDIAPKQYGTVHKFVCSEKRQKKTIYIIPCQSIKFILWYCAAGEKSLASSQFSVHGEYPSRLGHTHIHTSMITTMVAPFNRTICKTCLEAEKNPYTNSFQRQHKKGIKRRTFHVKYDWVIAKEQFVYFAYHLTRTRDAFENSLSTVPLWNNCWCTTKCFALISRIDEIMKVDIRQFYLFLSLWSWLVVSLEWTVSFGSGSQL